MPRSQSVSLIEFILTMLELDVRELRAQAGASPKAREAVGAWKVKARDPDALEGDLQRVADDLAAEILAEAGDVRSLRVDAYGDRGKYLRRWERTDEEEEGAALPATSAPGQGEGTLAERLLWRLIETLERREKQVGSILDSAARMMNAQASAYEASVAREQKAQEGKEAAEEEAREVAELANEIVARMRAGEDGEEPRKGASPLEKQAAEAVKELLKGVKKWAASGPTDDDRPKASESSDD